MPGLDLDAAFASAVRAATPSELAPVGTGAQHRALKQSFTDALRGYRAAVAAARERYDDETQQRLRDATRELATARTRAQSSRAGRARVNSATLLQLEQADLALA